MPRSGKHLWSRERRSQSEHHRHHRYLELSKDEDEDDYESRRLRLESRPRPSGTHPGPLHPRQTRVLQSAVRLMLIADIPRPMLYPLWSLPRPAASRSTHTTSRRASRPARHATTPTDRATDTGTGERRRARPAPTRPTTLDLQKPPPARRPTHRRRTKGALALRPGHSPTGTATPPGNAARERRTVMRGLYTIPARRSEGISTLAGIRPHTRPATTDGPRGSVVSATPAAPRPRFPLTRSSRLPSAWSSSCVWKAKRSTAARRAGQNCSTLQSSHGASDSPAPGYTKTRVGSARSS
jgi:hypothetical protein